MGDKLTLEEEYGSEEKVKLTYLENGKKKQKQGKIKEILKLVDEIRQDPKKSWTVIERVI